MKYFVFIILAVFLFQACEEEGPYINFNKDVTDSSLIDTTYIDPNTRTPQLKNVLIEDFTGVQCPNCPNAALKIEELKGDNPGRIVSVAIHAPTIFGIPYSKSKEDYRTFEDSMIWNVLGGGSQPIGGIDRMKFSGESKTLVQLNKWTSYVNQQLAIGNSPINISLTRQYDSITRELTVLAEVYYNTPTPDENYLMITLTESHIIDLQKMPTTEIDSFYEHNDVLRKMMTPFDGILLKENPEAKRVFIKEFKTKLKPHWKPGNMKIIAFVSRHNDDHDHDVFQVIEINLK